MEKNISFFSFFSTIFYKLTDLEKKKKPYFGTSILEIVKTYKSEIPFPLQKCVDYIEKNGKFWINLIEKGLTMDGIYRISGSHRQMGLVQTAFDSGENVNLDQFEMDKAVVTGVIKRYFAMLPEPIMTYELYPKFMYAQRISSIPERIRNIKELLCSLPKEHYVVLKFLIKHLCLVQKQKEQTKMGIINLAIVFGPTLFRSKDNSPTRMLTDSPILSGVVASMMKHFDYIFENAELDERNESEDFILKITSDMDVEQEMNVNENLLSLQQEEEMFAKKQNSFFDKRRRKIKEKIEEKEEEDVENLESKILEEIVSQEWKPISIDLSQSILSKPIKSWRNTQLVNELKVEYIEPIIEKVDEMNLVNRSIDDWTYEELRQEKSKLKRKLKVEKDVETLEKYKIIKKKLKERPIHCIVPHSCILTRKSKLEDIPEHLKNNLEYLQLKKEKKNVQKRLYQLNNEFYSRNGRKMSVKDRDSCKDLYILYEKIKQKIFDLENKK